MHVRASWKKILPLVMMTLLGCREAQFKVVFSEKGPAVDRSAPITVSNPSSPESQPPATNLPDYSSPLVAYSDTTCAVGKTFEESLAMSADASSGASSVKTSNIIIMLDTSPSMEEELALLAKALPEFIARLSGSLDASRHRVVLHSDARVALPASVYQHIDKVDSYNKILKIEEGLGIRSGKRILDSKLLWGAGTKFHYLLITDEPEDTWPDNSWDCSPGSRVILGGALSAYYPLRSLDSWMNYEKCLIDRHERNVGEFFKWRGFDHRLHAIHSKTPGSSMWPMLEQGGHPYVELTKAFGGKSFDITNPDWSGVLREFADAVVKETVQAGELKNCSLSSLKIQTASILQGEKIAALDVMNDLVFTQAADSRGASVQLNSGVLSSKGFDSSKSYTISLKTEVLGK